MKPFVVKELKFTMKFLISITLLIILQACTQKYEPIKKTPMENTQAKSNPYYSRTDTSKLNVSNEEWKKILAPDLYAIAREAATERAFTALSIKANCALLLMLHCFTLKFGFTFDVLIVPKIDGLSMWNTMIKEWVGIVAYWIAGYI